MELWTGVLLLCAGCAVGAGNLPGAAVGECGAQCNQVSSPCTCYNDGWIDCKNQTLESVPANLPNCSRLLAFGNNRISEIGVLEFQGLENVLEVMLFNNRLTRVDAGTFADMTKLRRLNLSVNLIEYVADCAFHGLTALTELELQHNRIQTIGVRAFDTMPCLTTIALFNNSLTTFNTQWFENKPNLTSVFDGGNPWDCTCEQKKAHTLLAVTHNFRKDCVFPILELAAEFCFRCATPASMVGKSLLTATLAEFSDCPTEAPATTAPAEPTTVLNQPTTEQSTSASNATISAVNMDDNNYCSVLVRSRITEAKQRLETTTANGGAEDHTDTTMLQDTTTWQDSTSRGRESAHNTSGSISTTASGATPGILPMAGLPSWAIALVVLAVAFMIGLIVAILILLVYRPRTWHQKEKMRSATSASPTDLKESGEMETFPTNNPEV